MIALRAAAAAPARGPAGLDYFDLGPLTPGRYVVAVGSLAQTSGPAPPASPAYAWASSIAALIVTAGAGSP